MRQDFQAAIPAQDFSDAFWRVLAQRWQAVIRRYLFEADVYAENAEKLRAQADYNTGSVPSAAGVALTALAAQLQPEVVFEVGSFIGNTTFALARRATHVWTCDKSNDIKLPIINVTQYPKTGSVDALKQFAKEGKTIDLLLADGRLGPDDVPLILQLTDKDTIMALDDCYQLEKGVANVDLLVRAMPDRQLYYIPPPRGEPFTTFGVFGGMTVGLLVPAHKLVVTKA